MGPNDELILGINEGRRKSPEETNKAAMAPLGRAVGPLVQVVDEEPQKSLKQELMVASEILFQPLSQEDVGQTGMATNHCQNIVHRVGHKSAKGPPAKRARVKDIVRRSRHTHALPELEWNNPPRR